jgi:hypothetical protein
MRVPSSVEAQPIPSLSEFILRLSGRGHFSSLLYELEINQCDRPVQLYTIELYGSNVNLTTK